VTDHGGAKSPKSTEADRAAFRALVPDDERVTVRPMFGSVAAFANTNMFMGLFADELFVRLAVAERAKLAALGGGVLEPMPGRPMKEYVTIPDWQARADDVREWAGRALQYALTLPPKKK
jgi:TfoX/Sxy family transcriptional regulator of competence genes